ncbi:MAG: M23 family metallopeptidase [Treponema sp.]|jgi:murein DD-endopeptidase MepM/ murein hydrolase activator NlpD|nr:M23 family metallopeptidase [Treponema sp.]
MKHLIAGQRVLRRKKQSLLSKAIAYHRSADNVNIIAQIRQKPARVKRRRPPAPSFKWSQFFSGRLKGIRQAAAEPWKKNGRSGPGLLKKAARLSVRRPGFTFPLPSLFSCLAAAGVLLLSILAFGIQDLVTPNLAFSAEPGADGEFERNMASYAGILPAPASAEPGEAIPLDLMETFAWSDYRVRRGDSVSKIAAAHSLSMDAIIAGNGITNARRLREGEIIRIPNMNGIPYTVKKGDSLEKISRSMGVPLEAILDANDLQSDIISAGTVLFIPGARMRAEDLKLALGELFIYPVRGRITSGFGWRNDPISGVRRFHAALDVAAPAGTAVKAAMDGRVSAVGVNSTYGNFIILNHGNGYQTLYAHLNAVLVRKDEAVSQGARIGEVGSTGYSTGPHLHFAVYKNGRAVNPLEYLNS